MICQLLFTYSHAFVKVFQYLWMRVYDVRTEDRVYMYGRDSPFPPAFSGKQTNPWFITLAPRKYTHDDISFEVVVRGQARFSNQKESSFSFLLLSFSRLLRFSPSFFLRLSSAFSLGPRGLDCAMTYTLEHGERDKPIEFMIIVK